MRRDAYLKSIENFHKSNPIVALLGPRQSGKTTLARQYQKVGTTFFDLEDPTDLARLQTPKLMLGGLRGLVVIDEIQRSPELFPVLRVLADRPGQPARFLILGSASRDLIRQSSETLAGRVAFMEISPFGLDEIKRSKRLWLRGGFPRSYLAKDLKESLAWRAAYVTTYLERDIPNLGIDIPAPTLRRFWMMLTHYHGQLFNASEIARSIDVSERTARRYIDILAGTFMVRRLPPWFENISKRQVKSPKIYFRDTGLLHSLLGIRGWSELHSHPKLGASWEGFALESVLRHFEVPSESAYFWATHNQAELDLFVAPGPGTGPKRLGFEFKFTDSPKLTTSMKIAQNDLKLDRLNIVIPGSFDPFLLDKNVRVIGLDRLPEKPGW